MPEINPLTPGGFALSSASICYNKAAGKGKDEGRRWSSPCSKLVLVEELHGVYTALNKEGDLPCIMLGRGNPVRRSLKRLTC